jgi:phosphoglycerate kinase
MLCYRNWGEVSMGVRSIEQIPKSELRGTNVLVRIDAGLKSGLDFTLPDSLRTLKHLINSGARTLVATHSSVSLDEIAERLSIMLGCAINRLSGWEHDQVLQAANRLGEGELLMLEDLSLHAGEELNDPSLAELLSRLCDVYCNDAFALAHQVRASTVGVAQRAKLSVAGAAFERELDMLELVLESPQSPTLALLAGELSIEKLKLIEAIYHRVNILLIGGQLCLPFLLAQGRSLRCIEVDEQMISIADRILNGAISENCDVMTPLDFIAVEASELDRLMKGKRLPVGLRAFSVEADELNDRLVTTRRLNDSIDSTFSVEVDELNNRLALCDIGQKTRWSWGEQFTVARTVFWHGPLGVCELEPFAEGTHFLAREFMSRIGGARRGVICGNALAGALRRFGIATEQIRHLSHAGRASLHYFAGYPLPAVDVLSRAEEAPHNKLHILIPLDGSEDDLVALREAAAIAASDAEIFLLHVRSGPDEEQRPDLVAALGPAERFERRIESERVFARANAVLASRGLVCADQIVAQGEVVEIILRYASRTGADLIVLGADDAQRVIERAPCAVLAAGRTAYDRRYALWIRS